MLKEDAFNDFDDINDEKDLRPESIEETPSVEPTVVQTESVAVEKPSILELPTFNRPMDIDDLPADFQTFIPPAPTVVENAPPIKHQDFGIGYKNKPKRRGRAKAVAKPQIVLPLTKGEIPHPFEDDFDIVDNQVTHPTAPGEVLRMPGERLHDWEWRKDFVERNRHTSTDINSVILYSKML